MSIDSTAVICADSTRLEQDEFLSTFYPDYILNPSRHLDLSDSNKNSLTASSESKPFFVTLTYAQSLDGKIAGLEGKQIILSGKESMALTHRLRELNDYCLVGIGTVLNDDPQLTARIPVMLPLESQTRPVVIDSNLRTPLNAKLIKNSNGKSQIISKPPIIFHSATASSERVSSLIAEGVECHASTHISGKLQLEQVIADLRRLDPSKKSIMIEGGASVITSFLNSGLFDLLIITIAPVFVGEGVGISTTNISLPKMNHMISKNFGQDVIVVCKPCKE